jgi:hypothetical protein
MPVNILDMRRITATLVELGQPSGSHEPDYIYPMQNLEICFIVSNRSQIQHLLPITTYLPGPIAKRPTLSACDDLHFHSAAWVLV